MRDFQFHASCPLANVMVIIGSSHRGINPPIIFPKENLYGPDAGLKVGWRNRHAE